MRLEVDGPLVVRESTPDVAFQLVPDDGPWQLTVATRNLFDEIYLVTGNSAFDTAAAYVEQVYGRPREFLVSLSYEF